MIRAISASRDEFNSRNLYGACIRRCKRDHMLYLLMGTVRLEVQILQNHDIVFAWTDDIDLEVHILDDGSFDARHYHGVADYGHFVLSAIESFVGSVVIAEDRQFGA